LSSTDPSQGVKINSLKPNWYYTWGRKSNVTVTAPWIPMAWGKGSIPKVNEFSTSPAILGFNEPDLAAQSNMNVTRALYYWPQILASGAARVGSPATAGNPTTAGSWLETFMNGDAKGKPKVDFICIHWYAPPKATSFLTLIDNIHIKYNLPIWVTEFAVADWNNKYPGGYPIDQVTAFMYNATQGLEKRSYVERYTWKTRDPLDTNMGTSSLFEIDGETLTPLGRLYASL
jgi:hypothetical protein